MAQLASAPALGAGGPPFESEYPDKKRNFQSKVPFFYRGTRAFFTSLTLRLCDYVAGLTSFALEAHSDSDAEAEGYVGVDYTKPVPEFEAVVVVGFGWSSESIACSYPSIYQETFIDILVADST